MFRILAMASLFSCCFVAGDDPVATFFDGKSLVGWDSLPGYWTIKDGSIVGGSSETIKFNTFLCSKQRFKDFELKFQVRLKDGKGNSGVQIRSEILDAKRFSAKGPQSDIGEASWGGLYG